MYHYPKDYYTISELIQKLEKSGMSIDSRTVAEEALRSIGYYRLKGYSYHFIDANTGKYQSGTLFSNILKLYYFDIDLKQLILAFASSIEVSLRAKLIEAFQITHDALVLYNPAQFKDKKHYWENQSTISSQVARSSDTFIQHHFERYEGNVPIWASVEIMSIGTLSKVIKNLKTGPNTPLSRLVENYKFINRHGTYTAPSKEMISSWIHATSVMRNICAHNGRIYNRVIHTTPQLLRADATTPQPNVNGLYQILLAMKYLRPTDESWYQFSHSFSQLLGKHNGTFDMRKMSFPSDWEAHFNI